MPKHPGFAKAPIVERHVTAHSSWRSLDAPEHAQRVLKPIDTGEGRAGTRKPALLFRLPMSFLLRFAARTQNLGAEMVERIEKNIGEELACQISDRQAAAAGQWC